MSPDSPDIFLTLSPYEYWSLIANLYELDKNNRGAKYTNTLSYLT